MTAVFWLLSLLSVGVLAYCAVELVAATDASREQWSDLGVDLLLILTVGAIAIAGVAVLFVR